MNRLISDDVLEELKIIDKYLSEGTHSIILICSSVTILRYVFTLIIRKCVLMSRCYYTCIPDVESNDIDFIVRRLSDNFRCVVGMKPSIYKSNSKKIIGTNKGLVLVHVDSRGMRVKISATGD